MIKSLSGEDKMERIGIYGGTYNPPHLGHLNSVESFIEVYRLDKVLIIPTYIPPHKISSDLASCEDRLEMCRRTFKGEAFEISDIEISREGKSYTEDTLKMLKGIYKDAELYFLVGEDMLLSFHTWRRPDDILDMCTLVADVRNEGTDLSVLREYAKEFFPTEYANNKIQFLEAEPLELSSTEVRNKIKAGESVCELLTAETCEYIKSRGLYRDRTQG